MANYNEKLRTWLENRPNPDAGINNIQMPGDVKHVIWQNRAHEPSAYEMALVENLITAFSSGATTLSEVVTALNTQGMLLESGEPFTEALFQAEMARLGY
ncbi:hypothetical protein DC083_02250 [Ignatzschineria ureiclastica]|uniref:Recombinase-like domain-containing protein n=1 Tax=Ignatzschineria ureiclastica TaxID=472582 RepID=A0A2U2AHB2_9GAMM|nr:recombinase-like helix-turn-helix domain-containing protein [Ignatzschineria ureiclastica]PWD82027.1 hypothetical protein DC083_02250 [Ignatzschineria ureiclastica]GGZ92135.1 hypothetical protein GCM10007162_04360 [Ignatzschineria ureiclastica]